MTQPVAVVGPGLWDSGALDARSWLIDCPASWKNGGGTAAVEAPWARAGTHPEGPPGTELADRIRGHLQDGAGFVVVGGLPLNGMDDAQCAALCRWFAGLTGVPRPPESAAPGDHLLTAPESSAAPDPHEVADKIAELPALAPHTDRAGPPGPPRVLALLCVRPAQRGGTSLLASGHTIHNRLLAQHPDALALLYQNFHFGAEPALTYRRPVFAPGSNTLHVHYNRHQIERGHHAAGTALTAGQRAALDAFDTVLADETIYARLPLRRGDLLLVNNTLVLHGRSSYSRVPGARGGRCLARAWAD